MNVGVDIDGVLFPWEDAVRAAVDDRFGVRLGPLNTWNAYERELGPTRWEWLFSEDGTEAVMGQTWRTYPGVIDAIRGVIELGHAVHFVTHRDPARTGLHTAEYLARQFGGLRWAGTHVVTAATAKRKLARWDVFVDDKPETVWDFMDNTATELFAPVRPWNTEELGEAVNLGLHHYTDPADIVRWVEART